MSLTKYDNKVIALNPIILPIRSSSPAVFGLR